MINHHSSDSSPLPDSHCALCYLLIESLHLGLALSSVLKASSNIISRSLSHLINKSLLICYIPPPHSNCCGYTNPEETRSLSNWTDSSHSPAYIDKRQSPVNYRAHPRHSWLTFFPDARKSSNRLENDKTGDYMVNEHLLSAGCTNYSCNAIINRK